MNALVPDPAWTLEGVGGALVLHAGADLSYALSGVGPDVGDEVLAAWRRGSLDRSGLSAEAGEVLDQLATAGAVRAGVVDGAPAASGSVCVVFAGEPVPGLGLGLAGEVGLHDDMSRAATVLIRTTGTLADLAASAAGLAGPHLVVDAAYHHTVSLGPFVVPGQTACAGCLAGRLAARWGDGAPPARPAAAWSPVVAAIVGHEVGKLARGEGSTLVNRTVAIDLDRWRSVEQAVLRLPWCEVCGGGPRAAGPDEGRIDLPWAPASTP